MNKDQRRLYISTIITIIISITLLFLAIFYYTNKLNLYKFKKNNLVLIYDKKLDSINKLLLPNDIYVTKFTVYNEGFETINSYKLLFKDLINTFSNDEYIYSLQCISYKNYGQKNQIIFGTCLSVDEKPIPQSDQEIINANVIDTKITHEYTMKMTFKDTGLNQNYNQGKLLGFKLTIE